MNIVIKAENVRRIEDAIKQAEGRATERTIDYLDLTYGIKEIEKRLDIPKVAMTGITAHIDYHAQTFANAYKYTPMSTHAVIKKTASGWNLIGVHRDACRTKRYILDLPEAAKQALVERCVRF